MKATRIVRRIDELGRIVIPKEIRKIIKIKEGESMEINIDDDNNIILSKFNLLTYKLEVWALSQESEEENICIDTREQQPLDEILAYLRKQYRFTEAETQDISFKFDQNYQDAIINIYGLEFYICVE